MAVLIEGISVVVRRIRIAERYPSGWEDFLFDVPNRTLCADQDLARVGFMAPADARQFVTVLGSRGLEFLRDSVATDVCVVDQLRGPTVRCDWLEFGTVRIDGHLVAACRLVGRGDPRLATPLGWHWEGSLSARPGFVAAGEANEHLLRLDAHDRLETYLDFRTGRERYLGRTQEGPSDPAGGAE